MAITITRDRSGAMRQSIRVRGHTLTADEPPANGGEDAGPDPHDLYDAAVGACKALTMVWYANRKGMPLEDVEVTIERDASKEQSGTYRLRASVSVTGTLDDTQRQQLLSVASKCPIHKLMTQVKTEIETVWKEPGAL